MPTFTLYQMRVVYSTGKVKKPICQSWIIRKRGSSCGIDGRREPTTQIWILTKIQRGPPPARQKTTWADPLTILFDRSHRRDRLDRLNKHSTRQHLFRLRSAWSADANLSKMSTQTAAVRQLVHGDNFSTRSATLAKPGRCRPTPRSPAIHTLLAEQ